MTLNRNLNRRFVERDRQWHPAAYTPGYKTSVPRSSVAGVRNCCSGE